MLTKNRYYKWLIWITLLFAYLIVIFHRWSFGVLEDELSAGFGMSAALFAGVGSMYFYAYMFMQIPTGMLVDSLGPRITVTAGMLLAGSGSFLFGCSYNIIYIFAGRFLIGIGVSVVFISTLKILSRWFEERKFGTMTGLTSFIGNTGGILTQSPFVIALSLISWRAAFEIIGAITLAIAFLCLAIVRNAPGEADDIRFNLIKKDEVQKEKIRIVPALVQILKNPRTWPPFFMNVGIYGAYQALAGVWGQSWLAKVYNLDKITTANYMLLLFIGAAFGSIAIGKLSDILMKRKTPMIIFGAVNLILWVFIVLFSKGKVPLEALGIILLLLGFSQSAIILSWACGKEVNNPRYAGMSMAVVNIGEFLGAAVIPVIAGVVIDKYSTALGIQQVYNASFVCYLISAAIGFISIFFIKETGCRNIFAFHHNE